MKNKYFDPTQKFIQAPDHFMGTKFPVDCIDIYSKDGNTITGKFNPDNMTSGQKLLAIASSYVNVNGIVKFAH